MLCVKLMTEINISQDFSIAIIVAILGVAFPIIIQTIAGIDTKYGSTRLVERIRRSWQYRFFIIILICAIIARIYYCFAPERIVEWNNLNGIIDHSAMLLVFLLLILLITALFLFIHLILRYYNPQKLLREIGRQVDFAHEQQLLKPVKHDKENPKSKQRRNEMPDERYFKDWTDLVLAIISSKNDITAADTTREAYQLLYEFVGVCSRNMAYKEITFPHYFYNSILSINRAICSQERKLTSPHNGNIVTQIFISDFLKTRLSQQSYSCIWMCLLEQLFKNRTDLVFEYWGWAYQHYGLVLSHRLYTGFVEDRGIEGLEHTVTEEDVANRDNDCKEFQLFNCALGGLLLYKKQYSLLGDIFYYKNSTTEFGHSLIPDAYSEIINIYLNINQINYADIIWLERRYPFPDMKGVNTNDRIKFWIEKYLAILMIRAEYVEQQYGGHYRTGLPQLPGKLNEKYRWKEQLERLTEIIAEVCKTIDIHQINEHLPKQPGVIADLRQYTQELQDAIDRQKAEQETDPGLVGEVYTSVKEGVREFLSMINPILELKTGDVPQPYRCQLGYFVAEKKEKGLYCTDQPYSRNGFADAMKSCTLNNLHYNLGRKLTDHTKQSLTCFGPDILHILDRLQLNDNYVVLVSNANYRNWFNDVETKMTKQDTSGFEYRYNGIPVFCLPNLQTSNACVWILQKTELPTMSFGDTLLNERFAKWMNKIGAGIFANVIDLYRTPEAKNLLNPDEQANNDEYVLELIDINIHLHYGDNAQIMRIILADQRDETSCTKWQDILPFEHYFTAME